MFTKMIGRQSAFVGLVGMLVSTLAAPPAMAAQTAPMRSEDFLNTLGVNTHLDGNSGWNTNTTTIASQLSYIGVRLDRDWCTNSGMAAKWKAVQSNWPMGRFWSSIDEASPAGQQNTLTLTEQAYTNYPNLIYALGGPNEEDDTFPQNYGATLPNSALLQGTLYSWAHSSGRNIPVSQMEFGAGWTSANNYEGDYNPSNTGINQNYTAGPADFGGAHTYISNTYQRPIDRLNTMRYNAGLTTPNKPVAHTEFGDYFQTNTTVWGQYCVLGAFDSAAAGDVGYIVYGLQDSDAMGFYDSSDTNPNPVANYYHTMTTILASTNGAYSPGQTPTYTPTAFSSTTINPSYSNTTTAQHLVLQKPTGEYVIAAWSEQLMNGSQASVSDSIAFGKSFSTVNVYDVQSGTAPIAILHNVSSYALTLNPCDTYLFVLSNSNAPIANGTYVLIPACQPGSRLDAWGGGTANGTGVGIYTSNGGQNQKWVVTLTSPPNTYSIRNANTSNEVLDADAAGTANGTKVTLWQDNSNVNQRWNITSLGNGKFKLNPSYSNSVALDVSGGANGAVVQLWQDVATQTLNQQWSFSAGP